MIEDLPIAVARLCGALRVSGVPVTLKDELDALDALPFVDEDDRWEVTLALRATLKLDPAAYGSLDQLLPLLWGAAPPGAPPVSPPRPPRSSARGKALSWDPVQQRLGQAAPSADNTGAERTPSYTAEALLQRKRFDADDWSQAELVTMERLLERLARKLEAEPSRRLVPSHGRGSLDLRRSLRKSVGTEGELLRWAHRRRALTHPRLVFVCDTSGSMMDTTRFLLMFVIALRRACPDAEAFVFNTELVRVTQLVKRGKLDVILTRLAEASRDWHGGTRIGQSLTTLVQEHAFRFGPKTTLVILSDGLDRGSPGLIGDALARLKRRVRKIIWLNPLSADPAFEPSARGMQEALPHLDYLGSAHDLDSFAAILPWLGARAHAFGNAFGDTPTMQD